MGTGGQVLGTLDTMNQVQGFGTARYTKGRGRGGEYGRG